MKFRIIVLTILSVIFCWISLKAQPVPGRVHYEEFDAVVNAGTFPCPTLVVTKLKVNCKTCAYNADAVLERQNSPAPCLYDNLKIELIRDPGIPASPVYNYPGPLISSFNPISFPDLFPGNYTLRMTYTRDLPGSGMIVFPPVETYFTIHDYCSGIALNCIPTNELCNPGNNGSINVNVTQSPRYLPYQVEAKKNGTIDNTFTISDAANIPFTLSSLQQASYIVKITDNYGTTSSCTTSVGLTNNVVISPIDINLPPYVCLHTPPFSLINSITTGGNFSGAGVASNIFTAKNAGEGLHTLLYSKTDVSRPVCSVTNVPVKILVQKSPPYINRVISATAAPMNDQWPNDFTDANTDGSIPSNLISSHIFNSGSKGIWRTEENYTYIEDRKQRRPTGINPNVDIRVDGIYDTLPLFLYNVGDMAGCFPRWRRMNTITKYNPYSNETENKDVLNRRSSALYGYKGDLATAVAVNSAETEIAYNGFEEFSAGDSLGTREMGPGNLTVFTSSPSSFSNDLFEEIQVISAVDNLLTLNATSAVVANLMGKTVKIFGAKMDAFDNKLTILGSYSVAAVDAAKKIITLASLSNVGVWKGKISLLNGYTVKRDYSLATVSLVTTTAAYPAPKFKAAHTGKNSLSVTGYLESELYKLKVNPDRNYVLSGWVLSTNPLDTLTYKSPVGAPQLRGMKLKFYDTNGNPTSPAESSTIEPSGPIIEGWQRVEGTIDLPANTARISLVLNAGGNTTLFDDLRIFPETGNIQTYVYNKENYKVSAVLDNNNYATFYYYDEQGNLFLLKKETEKGIKTIQESLSHQQE